mgnify:FL=1
MKILIGICTKHDKKEFENTPTYHSMFPELKGEDREDHILYTCYDMDGVVRKNNKENIGKHYNRILDMAVKEKYDAVVLMHDDIQMDDYGWPNKLEEAFKEYDIVGLAGAKQMEVKQPALWHLMSKQEDWSGAVAHPANDKQIFMTNFGPTPQRCLILDGLFLAVKVSSLKPEVRFDEDIPAIAHHYDLDFCLQANKHKLKLTTWPIWVIHKSPGLDKVDPSFNNSEKYFIDKWVRS